MESQRFSLAIDAVVPEGMTTDDVVNIIALVVQSGLVRREILTTKVEVAVGKFKPGTSGKPSAAAAPRGRKPINRPKIEAWIRANLQVGEPSGGHGISGVDREGKVETRSNRVFVGKLALPEEMGGVGLSTMAIDKVMKELETEGYLERGFAAGSPFFDYIRPLKPEGYTGPGVEFERASVREVDFTYAHIPAGKDRPSGIRPALTIVEN